MKTKNIRTIVAALAALLLIAPFVRSEDEKPSTETIGSRVLAG